MLKLAILKKNCKSYLITYKTEALLFLDFEIKQFKIHNIQNGRMQIVYRSKLKNTTCKSVEIAQISNLLNENIRFF